MSVFLREGILVAKDLGKSVKYAQCAAEKGHLRAASNYAIALVRGEGIPKDSKKAAEIFLHVIELLESQENELKARAQYNYGWLCYIGDGVQRSYSEAVKYLRLSEAGGCARAKQLLGNCYYFGHGVDKDVVKAFEYWEDAAQCGDVTAQYNLGICYYYGDGVPQNMDNATKYFRSAADAGYPPAQYNYGLILHHLEENPEEYWGKAAAHGHLPSAYSLAMLKYADNRGVTDDTIRQCRKLAEIHHHREAVYNLGVCLYHGDGVKEDKDMAAYHFKEAADGGSSWGKCNYGVCLFLGHGVDMNREEARRYFQSSANDENPYGMYNYGICLYYGMGVDRDRDEGVEYVRWAIENAGEDDVNFCSMARVMYGIFLNFGEGVEQNEEEAERLFTEVESSECQVKWKIAARDALAGHYKVVGEEEILSMAPIDTSLEMIATCDDNPVSVVDGQEMALPQQEVTAVRSGWRKIECC